MKGNQHGATVTSNALDCAALSADSLTTGRRTGPGDRNVAPADCEAEDSGSTRLHMPHSSAVPGGGDHFRLAHARRQISPVGSRAMVPESSINVSIAWT